jgi:quinol monooxygenase YgiN
MLVTTVYFDCNETSRDIFLKELRNLVKYTQKEDGCISFSFYHSMEVSNRYMLLEEWKDSEAIEFHKKQDYYLHFNQLSTELFEKKSVQNYQISDCRPGGEL